MPERPAFLLDDCDLDTPAGAKVECGWLSVPENRRRQDSKLIRLRVAVFKAAPVVDGRPPLVYLEGGPGGNAIEGVIRAYDEGYRDFASDRDLIVVDQRGTGLSEPALDCPEVSDTSRALFTGEITAEQAETQGNQAVVACLVRLNAEGWDLAAYNSAQSAADIEDLRRALGYERWDLWGISYGTRLALTVVRDFPQGVRAVVLDSAYPLEVNLQTSITGNLVAAFERVWAACDRHPVCGQHYPGLEEAFFRLISDLEAQPAPLTITDPADGTELAGRLDGAGFAGLLFQGMYSARVLPLLPEIITDAAGGDLSTLRLLAQSSLAQDEFISSGMNVAVQCIDELAYTTAAELDAATQSVPAAWHNTLTGQSSGAESLAVCAALGEFEAPAKENQPVSNGRVPVLVLAGEFDPITPPEWGRQVAGQFDKGSFFLIPATGHAVTIASGNCPRQIALAFLDDPEAVPDGACIDPGAVLQIPVPSAQTVMAPWEDRELGVRGSRPQDWPLDHPGPGVALALRPGLGDTGLLHMALPAVPVAFLVTQLARQFGLTQSLTPVATRDASGMGWTLYLPALVEGSLLDMAVAQAPDGTALVVILISPPSKRDAYYEPVYLKAIDTLTTLP